jgi:hypothetical protein
MARSALSFLLAVAVAALALTAAPVAEAARAHPPANGRGRKLRTLGLIDSLLTGTSTGSGYAGRYYNNDDDSSGYYYPQQQNYYYNGAGWGSGSGAYVVTRPSFSSPYYNNDNGWGRPSYTGGWSNYGGGGWGRGYGGGGGGWGRGYGRH